MRTRLLALPVLLLGFLPRGCAPAPTPNQIVVAQCAAWKRENLPMIDGRAGCAYIERKPTGDPGYYHLVLHLGDKIAADGPFCVRATYPTKYVQLYCTRYIQNWATANNQWPKLAVA